MASSQPVHPLRISKTGPTSSPTKMASAIPRPLSELSPTEKRRNSPSWNQTTKKMTLNTDSSPFQSSPLDSTTSPRLFWQNKNTTNVENNLYSGQSGSPSPVRRSSIERLQKASRVKNSNILALEQKQEYDPARVAQIERPLAKQVQGNAYGGTGIAGLRSSPERKPRGLGHHRNESQTNIPLYSPTKSRPPATPTVTSTPYTPRKDQMSPMKSSLSTKFKGSFDPETGTWSAEENSGDERELPAGKSLHRHAKSVTFDAAPPQINEYEMATPDLSSVGSYSREGSYESTEDDEDMEHFREGEAHGQDDSFDASLEDTAKTPVVGPDDWRQNSPDRNEAFESSPMPDGDASKAASKRPAATRTDSSNSAGDFRPLPPLPGMPDLARTLSSGSTGLSTTAERMNGTQRGLPSPPPAAASTTKREIQNIGNAKMTLEERLKLMMLSDDSTGKSPAEQQRERRMRRAGAKERVGSQTPEPETHNPTTTGEEDDTIGDLSGLDEYQLPPKISRESILRRVNGNIGPEQENEYRFSSPALGSSPERRLPLDPDIPIPSTEDSFHDMDMSESSVIIHRDDDHYDIPDLYQRSSDEDEGDQAVKDDDEDSQYSDDPASKAKDSGSDEDSTETPTVADFRSTMPLPAKNSVEDSVMSKSLQSQPMTNAADSNEPTRMADVHAYMQRPFTPDHTLPRPEYDGSGWGEPEEYDEPGTPDSVIHHPMSDDESARDSPAIPERVATIKASGTKLKTRASATPSDLMAMREARRQVSREIVPPIPERHRNRISRDMDAEEGAADEHNEFLERHPSFKNRSLTLDLDYGLSLDQDFERVIEAQKVAFPCFISTDSKIQRPASRSNASQSLVQGDQPLTSTNISTRKQRGYLMRQNTKLVAASDKEGDDRGTRSAGNSPVKKDRPQSWTVEPWNGQVRKKSVRKQRPGMNGPVPPLPGQESNAAALSSLAEEELSTELATEEAGERGRLFVKVMGVKDLDLPIPKNERTWFSLTLDNGVHCVTTAWLELARNAPIGQEFELVVPNDLEFQLTLNVKLERPQPRVVHSPTKMSKSKTSTFSRVFASPKKRKEMELRQREEDERAAYEQREAQARQLNTAPSAWDLLSPLAAEDGSFARAYVCLKEHEARCFGRPYLAEVACFNEWAVEEAGFASSVKSKRGNTSVVRRAPYKVGKLELQLLFCPRPKGATDDDMPKSMNSCIRELKAAEERLARNWEGHLSQQGGDCPYWRRRYFKLNGVKLTAYHEATRQPRATINLANARRLIDDRRTLTEKETTGKNGRRRKSAFAEEEEGYMFVEEGFRVRFNNGEVIDFYADTAEDKEGWMKVLSDVVGKDSRESDDGSIISGTSSSRAKGKWCEIVFKREEALRRRAEGRAEGRRVHSRTKSMYV